MPETWGLVGGGAGWGCHWLWLWHHIEAVSLPQRRLASSLFAVLLSLPCSPAAPPVTACLLQTNCLAPLAKVIDDNFGEHQHPLVVCPACPAALGAALGAATLCMRCGCKTPGCCCCCRWVQTPSPLPPTHLPALPLLPLWSSCRHPRGPDDHRARHHRHPEDGGRPLQEGLARRPW